MYIRRFLKRTNVIPFGIIIVIVVGIFFFLQKTLTSANSTSNISGDQRIQVKGAKATESLDKTFDFPLKDDTGKEVSKLKYTILSAEKRDEIIVQGKKANSIKGRTFLIINLKLQNNYQKTVQINVRDYMRLTMDGNSDSLAPDIHNDPVEVQAISTKLTRVGFPINDTDKNLALHLGEISGKKTEIPLKF